MLNNPIVGSLGRGQRRALPLSGKHVCIFGLERKGALITANVVCTVCGVYLSSLPDRATRHKINIPSIKSEMAAN